MSVIDNVLLFCFSSIILLYTPVLDNGHEDVVKLLLEQPAVNVDARDEVRVHYGNISIVS